MHFFINILKGKYFILIEIVNNKDNLLNRYL